MLEIALNLALPFKSGRILDEFSDLGLVDADARFHIHRLREGDIFGARDKLRRLKFIQERVNGAVEVRHLQITELNRASDGHGRVGLGDRHLIVRVVLTAPTVIGLEEQLAMVRDEEAVYFAVLTVRDLMGEF